MCVYYIVSKIEMLISDQCFKLSKLSIIINQSQTKHLNDLCIMVNNLSHLSDYDLINDGLFIAFGVPKLAVLHAQYAPKSIKLCPFF